MRCIIFFFAAMTFMSQPLIAGAATSSLVHVEADALPALTPDGDLSSFKTTLEREVAGCREQGERRTLMFEGRKLNLKQWCVETGVAMAKLAGECKDFAEFWARAKTEFDWYKSKGSDGNGAVMFTGYYFPVLGGSRTETGAYAHPLYRRPDELVRVEIGGSLKWRRKNADATYSLFPDRRAIDLEGALKDKGYELAYVDDAFSAFVLHVQGSGAVLLHEADGTTKRIIVNYAAQNGREYVALRRVLAERGVGEEFLTIPGMRKYFEAHAGELMETLAANPSYVFFQEASEGPFGATTTVLTPGHSIAVDPRFLPLSAVAFLKTERPVVQNGEVTGWEAFSRFAVSQDIGGAIRSAGRVDVYWGEGDYAELAAGHMNQPGELYFAIKK
ncbi:MAG: MltA domain-containing protein [Deltaproteobacteria bacterium]|nr:MltA domain-containing protein [Deltaproteobacteria bacterium]